MTWFLDLIGVSYGTVRTLLPSHATYSALENPGDSTGPVRTGDSNGSWPDQQLPCARSLAPKEQVSTKQWQLFFKRKWGNIVTKKSKSKCPHVEVSGEREQRN